MMNPFAEVDWHPGLEKRRSFAISLIVGFPCVALVLLAAGYWRTAQIDVGIPLAVALWGAGTGVLFLLVPAIVRPFYVAWYFIACCVGIVVGNVLLSLVYYVFVAGAGFSLRLLGRRRRVWSMDKSRPSYWQDAHPPDHPERYYRQF